jgi:hypothetical protein
MKFVIICSLLQPPAIYQINRTEELILLVNIILITAYKYSQIMQKSDLRVNTL